MPSASSGVATTADAAGAWCAAAALRRWDAVEGPGAELVQKSLRGGVAHIRILQKESLVQKKSLVDSLAAQVIDQDHGHFVWMTRIRPTF